MKRYWLSMMAVLAGACLVAVQLRGQAQQKWPEIAGYEAMKIPADNPMTPAKVELGRQLYYDTRLSGDGTRSCYACHLKDKGLTDGKANAVGAWGVVIARSSPTMWNIGYHSEFYWDGRAKSLEAQARAAWSGGNMGATGKSGQPSQPTIDDICAQLNRVEGYRKQFQVVFSQNANPDNVTKALAAFMRTIVSNDSAWIRFREGDKRALSSQAQRGWAIFSGKARCTNCHAGLLLTDLQYHNTGIGMEAKEPDLGRHRVTQQERDKGAFKTPTLVDIGKSAPYFHDGSKATLEEAVDVMLAGGIENPWLDSANLRPPVNLTKTERDDLLAFLRSLDAHYRIKPPKLPE